jgi:hypothetical protein
MKSRIVADAVPRLPHSPTCTLVKLGDSAVRSALLHGQTQTVMPVNAPPLIRVKAPIIAEAHSRLEFCKSRLSDDHTGRSGRFCASANIN